MNWLALTALGLLAWRQHMLEQELAETKRTLSQWHRVLNAALTHTDIGDALPATP